MGNKINPHSLRLGIIENWDSRWLSKAGFKQFLEEDLLIRKIISEKLANAGVSRVEIERLASVIKIIIKTARPGLVIGRSGKGVEDLKRLIERNILNLRQQYKDTNVSKSKVSINLVVEEMKRSEISAAVIAQNIAQDIKKRIHFRRIMKKTLETMMQNREVKGAKIRLSGRLGGAEIARSEWLAKGKIPLHTLRSIIDFSRATAYTTYGTVGIKVWIYKGEVFEKHE